MNVTITPQLLSGSITPPPSKSQAHRALIAAALSGSGSVLSNLAESQDILATRACMEILNSTRLGLPHLDCGESGSTLRFLIPVALALRGGGVFTGRGRLMERPQEPYFELFREKGIFYQQQDGLLKVAGELTAGTYALRGNVSSQFITGLLYALPLLEKDSLLLLTTELESKGYVDMTLDVLSRFGVTVRAEGSGYVIPGGQQYCPHSMTIEGDYSQAAFYCAMNGLGSRVTLLGLSDNSVQGDRCILDYTQALSGPGLVTLDVSQCPDLVPALAVQAALRAGETTCIQNAGRLRIKESDRLAAVAEELNRLGARVEEGPDSLTVTGVSTLTGGVCQAHNDHRIAMMLAVAATRASGPVTVEGAECVHKSYPDFWEDYKHLGGVFT